MPYQPAVRKSSFIRFTRQNNREFRRRAISRPWLEYLEDRTVLSTLTVTNTLDSGAGSLRQAIIDANANTSVDRIAFSIPTNDANHLYYRNDNLSGKVTPADVVPTAAANDTMIFDVDPDWTQSWWRITPLTPLPALTRAVTIDGYSQSGAQSNTLSHGDNAILRIELDGNGLVASGLILEANNATVQGLVINSFSGFAYQGQIDLEGYSAGFGAPDVPITGNEVQGNFIGTDVSGSIAEGSSYAAPGVILNIAGSTTIGGPAVADGNLISGNGGSGIAIGGESAGNDVEGNEIGTDASGIVALGNGVDGVVVNGGYYGSLNNTIGGALAGQGNVIAANAAAGVSLAGAVAGAWVAGNLIGVNAAGTAALGNGTDGVLDDETHRGATGLTGVTIGGSVTGVGNVISANHGWGIRVAHEDGGDLIEGNSIGTNVSGTAALGNGQGGISLISVASPVTIGGPTPYAGNLISGNHGRGVFLGDGTAFNVIQRNLIGTDVTGTQALGNASDGVFLDSETSGNQIGGTAPGAANTIAFNGSDALHSGIGAAIGNGVHLFVSGSDNAILGNSIFANELLGIDLNATGYAVGDGVTANSPGGPHSGPNDLQNYPVLQSAATCSTETVITGTLVGQSVTTFRVEFFADKAADPSNHGQGETYLGFTNVTTDASGTATFMARLPVPLPTGAGIVSATATDPNGNTSEFSADVAATTLVATTTTLSVSPTSSLAGQTVTFTATATPATSTSNSPTGSVVFAIDGTPGTPVPLASDTAKFTTSTLAAGVHTITATYDGDAAFGDSVSAPVQATVTIPLPDLQVTIGSASPNPAGANQPYSYTITVTNVGLGTATDVTLTDSLGDFIGVGAISVHQSQGSGAVISYSTPPTIIRFGLDSLGPGAFATCTVTQTPGDAGTFTDSLTASEAETDANTADNSATVTEAVLPPDLQISVDGPAHSDAANQVYYYTVTVTNVGVGTATGVTLTDILGNHSGLSDAYASTPQGSPFVVSQAGGTTTISVDLATLAPGASVKCIIAQVPTSDGTYTDSLSVTAPAGDANPADNSTSVTEVVGTPVLQVSVSDPTPSPAGVYEPFTYYVTVSNSGAGDANILGVNAQWIDGGDGQGLAVLPAHTSHTFTFTHSESAPGTYDVTFSIASDEINQFFVNGKSEEVVPPVLVPTITGPSPSPAGVYQPFTYTVRLFNAGPGDATDVEVNGTWGGPGGSASSSDGILLLKANSDYTFTFTQTESVAGTYDSTFSIASDEVNEFFVNGNSETVVPPVLVPTISGPSPSPAGVYQAFTYTVRLFNAGPGDATDVEVNGTWGGPGGSASSSDGILLLKANSDYTFTFTQAEPEVGTYDSTFSIASDEVNEFFVNGNSETVVPPDLEVGISGPAPSPAGVNEPFTYSVTVRNDGPGDAEDIGVIDSWVDPAAPGGRGTAGEGVALLQANTSLTFTFTRAESVPGTYDSTFSVASDEVNQFFVHGAPETIVAVYAYGGTTYKSLQNSPISASAVPLAVFFANTGQPLVRSDWSSTIDWTDGITDSSAAANVTLSLTDNVITIYGNHTYRTGGVKAPVATLFFKGQRLPGDTSTATINVADDVSSSVTMSAPGFTLNRGTNLYYGTETITSTTSKDIPGGLMILLQGLPSGVSLLNATITIGSTTVNLSITSAPNGSPVVTIPKALIAKLVARQSLKVTLGFSDPSKARINYVAQLFSDPYSI